MGSLGMINMSEKQKKGPVVVGWQHKNALFQPVSKTEKQTGSYSMWSVVQGTPPPPHTHTHLPPSALFLFWVFDFNNLCPAAACKGKLCDTPLHLLSVGRLSSWQQRVGQGNGLSLWGRSPPPTRPLSPSFCSLPLASSPTFVSQMAFYFALTATGPRELPSPLWTVSECLSSGPIATWQHGGALRY